MMDISGFRLRWTPTDGTLEVEEIATKRVKPASITELMDKGEGMGYLIDMALKHPFAWCSTEQRAN